MSYAILKLSYNAIGDSQLEGGICGTGFFINKRIFLTAHHVLNSNSKKPNNGFKYCQFWLVSRNNQIIELSNETIKDFPAIDSCVIDFTHDQSVTCQNVNINIPIAAGKISNLGYVGSCMPKIDACWFDKKLSIGSIDVAKCIADGSGNINSIRKNTVSSNDVNIKDKTVLITSYPGIVGMSGGALLNDQNEIIGLLSLGLPPDALKKEFMGAIWIKEVLEIIKFGA